MKKKSAGELSRTVAGQLSKTEKRIKLARSIRQFNDLAYQTVKAFKRSQYQQ